MDTIVKKKLRSSNWTEQEKKILRILILERAEIIENKDYNTKINLAKKLAWREVLARFNALSPSKRNLFQLLNQWRNMKNRAKNAYRSARAQTSGGPPTPSPPPEDVEFVSPSQSSKCSPNQSIKKKESRTKVYKPDSCECRVSHEHQLFMLTKQSRDEAMRREEEAHAKKMAIMALEEEYWRLKVIKLE